MKIYRSTSAGEQKNSAGGEKRGRGREGESRKAKRKWVPRGDIYGQACFVPFIRANLDFTPKAGV